jgi:hypothetical protein
MFDDLIIIEAALASKVVDPVVRELIDHDHDAVVIIVALELYFGFAAPDAALALAWRKGLGKGQVLFDN